MGHALDGAIGAMTWRRAADGWGSTAPGSGRSWGDALRVLLW